MEFTPDGPMAIPLWINGHAFLTVTPVFFDVIDASSGKAVRKVPLCDVSQAQQAVNAARGAQPLWAEMGLPARRVCLGQMADGLDRYKGHFGKLLIQETGCDEVQATGEVDAAVNALRGSSVGETGVFALVVDASRPLSRFAEAVAPALLAGATVVVKPSPKAPSAIYALCELSGRIEWPGGVLNLLQGDTAAIEGLCQCGVDRLVFSGNPVLGEQLAAIVGAQGTPFIVQADGETS